MKHGELIKKVPVKGGERGQYQGTDRFNQEIDNKDFYNLMTELNERNTTTLYTILKTTISQDKNLNIPVAQYLNFREKLDMQLIKWNYSDLDTVIFLYERFSKQILHGEGIKDSNSAKKALKKIEQIRSEVPYYLFDRYGNTEAHYTK